MGLNWLESIVYALISGVTEILPVSSRAHQQLLLNLFGGTVNTTLLDLMIHIAVLTALYINCQNSISRIQRQRKLLQIPKRRRKHQPDWQAVSELRLVKTAAIPIVLGVLFTQLVQSLSGKLHLLSLFLVVNGILLYTTGRIAIGNKSAGSMSRFDGFLVGLAGTLGMLPGISRMGCALSVSIMRGADPQRALNWCLILSVPALLALCVADVFLMFTLGVGTFGFLMLIQCLFSALFAYLGATLAIMLLRYMAVKVGFSWFSYYSWGLAMLSFLLFMI